MNKQQKFKELQDFAKNLVGLDELDKVLEDFLPIKFELNEKKTSDLLSVKARHYSNERNNMKGSVSADEFKTEKARIRDAILSFIENLKLSDLPTFESTEYPADIFLFTFSDQRWEELSNMIANNSTWNRGNMENRMEIPSSREYPNALILFDATGTTPHQNAAEFYQIPEAEQGFYWFLVHLRVWTPFPIIFVGPSSFFFEEFNRKMSKANKNNLKARLEEEIIEIHKYLV
jgi:hypothetical protein